MCGIAGEVSYQKHEITPQWVHHACGAMSHRGPDGDGFMDDGFVALGHRRLAVIDLAGGVQPMSYHDRYTITYNGEIYNYRQLREELRQEGMSFQTNSDTEVILAAYAFWGVDCLKRFNGIFSFAIWDNEAQTLLLARDHLGVKPMLYHHDEQGLCFASELKALLAHPRVSAEISPEALDDYLMMGYVLSPRTIIQDVHKLPPAHFLLVREGNIRIEQYWDLAEATQSQKTIANEAEAIETFSNFFRNKVQEQMVSDVPVGAFLSGGIDSSSISVFANQFTPHQLKTFSAGFSEASYSELDYAELVARHIDTDHQQDIIPPQSLETLSNLVWKYDEPLGDTSLISTYFVAELAREQVTVVLSGDGGDELLAGYDTYLADKAQSIYRRLPSFIHHGLMLPFTNRLGSSYKKVSWDFKLKQFVSQAYTTPERAHFGWRLMFRENEVTGLTGTTHDYHPFDTYSKHYDDVASASRLNQSLYVDIKTWMVDDILAKVDRATMACSLEARVPFLAPDFVEHAMRLPDTLKLRGLQRKYILKQAMRKHLPDDVIDRKKRGFNTPVGIWLRGDLAREIDDMLTRADSQLIDLAHPTVKTMWAEHKNGQVDHTFKLWTLVSLLLWEESVFKQSVAVHD